VADGEPPPDPAALHVRIAPAHPGASPSAAEPGSLGAGIARLFSIASGSGG
jgi:hypothetical protein